MPVGSGWNTKGANPKSIVCLVKQKASFQLNRVFLLYEFLLPFRRRLARDVQDDALSQATSLPLLESAQTCVGSRPMLTAGRGAEVLLDGHDSAPANWSLASSSVTSRRGPTDIPSCLLSAPQGSPLYYPPRRLFFLSLYLPESL